MASDRLAELLRSTCELTEEEINLMTENEAWELIHAGALKTDKTDESAHRSYQGQLGHHNPDRA